MKVVKIQPFFFEEATRSFSRMGNMDYWFRSIQKADCAIFCVDLSRPIKSELSSLKQATRHLPSQSKNVPILVVGLKNEIKKIESEEASSKFPNYIGEIDLSIDKCEDIRVLISSYILEAIQNHQNQSTLKSFSFSKQPNVISQKPRTSSQKEQRGLEIEQKLQKSQKNSKISKIIC